jgi:hypothetical protein
MDPEHERLAEALTVERNHGDRAPAFTAERVAKLALAGDLAGVASWNAVALRYDQLTRGLRR